MQSARGDLGFKAETAFDDIIRAHIEDELGGKIVDLMPTALAPYAANLTLKLMTYVDAAVAPLRKTGQIKIHGPAAFEAMRKAGQLVARCLDMLTEHVGPACRPKKSTGWCSIRHGSWRPSRDVDVSRLQEVDLHVSQSCGLPRHSRRQAAEGWRHRQYRRDADPRRLARRFQPHVSRSAKFRAAPNG